MTGPRQGADGTGPERPGSTPPLRRVAVVGAGVIGTIFASAYRRAGLEVALVERDPRRLADLRAGRVRLVLPSGEEEPVGAPAHGYPLPALEPFDLVQVSVKGYDTPRAARDLLPLLGAHTLVLSVQNGLGNLEALAASAGPERVVGGITAHSGEAVDPTRVRYVGGVGPLMAVGPLVRPPAPDLAARLAELAARLRACGYGVELVDDLEAVVWKKLLANAATNPVAALTRRTGAGILASAPLRRLVDLLAAEVASVARARGLSFDELDDPGGFARWALAGVRDNRISMLQDVEAGRPTEIGSLNEAVCREGDRLGVPTPANAAVALLVRTLEEAPPPAVSGSPEG